MLHLLLITLDTKIFFLCGRPHRLSPQPHFWSSMGRCWQLPGGEFVASWRKFQVRCAISPPKIFAGHRRHGVRSC